MRLYARILIAQQGSDAVLTTLDWTTPDALEVLLGSMGVQICHSDNDVEFSGNDSDAKECGIDLVTMPVPDLVTFDLLRSVAHAPVRESQTDGNAAIADVIPARVRDVLQIMYVIACVHVLLRGSV